MRYERIEDLPESLRSVLPEEAQKTYLEAYRASWNAYKEHEGGELERESVAHRDGWHAVRENFVKEETSGRWYKKGELPEEEEDEESLIDQITDVFK
ncbi:MAG: ChaB family protein [Anaerolineae bacterium]